MKSKLADLPYRVPMTPNVTPRLTKSRKGPTVPGDEHLV